MSREGQGYPIDFVGGCLMRVPSHDRATRRFKAQLTATVPTEREEFVFFRKTRRVSAATGNLKVYGNYT